MELFWRSCDVPETRNKTNPGTLPANERIREQEGAVAGADRPRTSFVLFFRHHHFAARRERIFGSYVSHTRCTGWPRKTGPSSSGRVRKPQSNQELKVGRCETMASRYQVSPWPLLFQGCRVSRQVGRQVGWIVCRSGRSPPVTLGVHVRTALANICVVPFALPRKRRFRGLRRLCFLCFNLINIHMKKVQKEKEKG